MKKILSVLLTIVLILGLTPVSSVSVASSGSFEYEVDSNGNATITKYNGTSDTICIIPDTLDGYPVVAIGDYAFSSASTLQNVMIPSSVTRIGDGAFMSATNLQNVIIQGNSLLSIGSSAFWGCTNLMTILIPKSVTSIGAFCSV